MSSPLAIAAVTEILVEEIQSVLEADLLLSSPDLVTVGSPQRVRESRTDPQVNLCLYQLAPNAAWRNQDLPTIKPGERASPLLPLKLSYLLTVYGALNDDRQAHQMLGSIMLRLHDRAILPRNQSKLAQESGLSEQVESVRLTIQPLTLDEITKLWSAFQSPYQLSTAYEVSVVLIDSKQPTRSAPPVLSRGEAGTNNIPEDRGFPPEPFFPEPILETIQYLPAQIGLQHGSKLTLKGKNLDGDGLRLVFTHPRIKTSRIAKLESTAIRKNSSIEAIFPNDFRFLEEDPLTNYVNLKSVTGDRSNWPSGVYTVVGARIPKIDPAKPDEPFDIQKPLRLYSTSPVFLALLPQPINLPIRMFVDREQGDPAIITNADLEFDLATPLCFQGQEITQSIRLFIGNLELIGTIDLLSPVGPLTPGQSIKWVASDPSSIVSAIYDIPALARFFRIQVDGVDSSLIAIPADPKDLKREYNPQLLVQINDPEKP